MALASTEKYARLKFRMIHIRMGTMEARECFRKEQFGYCWLEGRQWMFQPVDVTGKPLGEPSGLI